MDRSNIEHAEAPMRKDLDSIDKVQPPMRPGGVAVKRFVGPPLRSCACARVGAPGRLPENRRFLFLS